MRRGCCTSLTIARVLFVAAALVRTLGAQSPSPVGVVYRTTSVADAHVTARSTVDLRLFAVAPTVPSPSAPWWAPLASGVVPGAGQFALGQQRSVAYLVVEGYLLLQAVSARRDGDRDRDAYRALAANVARSAFGGDRPLGPWEYYETMERFLESGLFDRVPGGAVDPETDATTFNGARWLLARETFWRDPNVAPPVSSPEYQRAMAFYVERAVGDAFRWSWRDAQLEQGVYRDVIASANRRYQRAVTMTGLLGANHLISLIDAYVNVRVRRYGGAGMGGLRVSSVHSQLRPVGDPALGQAQWQMSVRLVPSR